MKEPDLFYSVSLVLGHFTVQMFSSINVFWKLKKNLNMNIYLQKYGNHLKYWSQESFKRI